MSHIIPHKGILELPGWRSGDLALICRAHAGRVRIHVEATEGEPNQDRKIVELDEEQIIKLAEFLTSGENMWDKD